jgi:hypothetical protein
MKQVVIGNKVYTVDPDIKKVMAARRRKKKK